MSSRLQNFSQDLVEEVLVWLPAETLLKFRCVSKSWRALIDSTHFKQLHLRRISSWTSPGEQNKFLFRWSGPYLKRTMLEERVYVAEIDSRDLMLKRTVLELHRPRPFKHVKDLRPRICGSCNGLLCLRYYDSSLGNTPSNPDLILWNPYINKYWELPSYPRPVSVNTVCSYGFGYDDIANDFKVVTRFEVSKYNNNNNHFDDETLVYSLKSNSWTSLPQFPSSHPNPTIARGNGIHVKCALHWMLHATLDRDDAILALDLRTHKCNRIALPPDVVIRKKTRLEAFDGCLCLISQHKFREPSLDLEPFLDLRIMKDYGVEDSWTKLIIQLPTVESMVSRTPVHPVAYSQRSTKIFFKGPHWAMWYDAVERDWDWASLVATPTSYMRGFLHFIGSLAEPYPVTTTIVENTGTSTQSAAIKRVQANLFC